VHVGVDIDGTFTDIVLRLPDGTLRVSKVSSTPEDPGLAVPNLIAFDMGGTTTSSRLRFKYDTNWPSRLLWSRSASRT
jgi:N-methylhydantoinase A